MSRLLDLLRSPWVRRAFVVLAVGAAVVAVVLQREAVGEALATADWGWVAVALLLALVTAVLAMLSWRAVSAGYGAALSVLDASVVYLVGQVGKYLPGGVWNVLASAELAGDRGVARRRTVGTMLVAVLVSAAVAGMLTLLLLPGLPGTPLAGHGWLRWLTPLGLVAIAPPVLNTLLATLLRLTRQEPVEERIGLGAVTRSTLWSLASWLAAGLSVHALALSMGAEHSATLLRLCVGGYAVAWLVGFVLVFLPAGVGAREGVLGLVLAAALGPGAVVVVVLLSRVLVTLADLLGAGLAALAGRRLAG